MSALQCPTRIFLARHGEAEYETTLITDDGGSLTSAGRAQARALAERLRSERVARVWSSPLSRAVQTAEIAAAALGVDVVVREGLREYGVGALAGTAGDELAEIGPVFRAWVGGDDAAAIPGGESLAGTIGRVREVLDEIADQHPGEAVLVVSHGGVLMASYPGLAGLPRAAAYDIDLAPTGLLAFEVDADGWRRVSESDKG